jgi:hypothetical protein
MNPAEELTVECAGAKAGLLYKYSKPGDYYELDSAWFHNP